MSTVRIIARLDVKAPNLIKGIHLEGLRKIGDPNDYARRYYEAGADEIVYMDIVASLYERNSLLDIVERTTRDPTQRLVSPLRFLTTSTATLDVQLQRVFMTFAVAAPNARFQILTTFCF